MGSLVSLSGMPALTRPETMPEAALDQDVSGRDLPAERDAAATPLQPAEPDALVVGIAAVFAAFEHSDRHAPSDGDAEAALEEDITFALLGELNRLWASPELAGGQH